MALQPLPLAELLRDQLLWELNGVRHLVYTSGSGSRIAVLKETPIRINNGSRNGWYQLKCVVKHVTDALFVFDPEVGRQLDLIRKVGTGLYTSAWLDIAERGLATDLATVANKLPNEITFQLGLDDAVHGVVTATVGARLQWFTLPSVTFHKTLVYNTLVTAGMTGIGKWQLFGLSQRTSDGIRNTQLFRRDT